MIINITKIAEISPKISCIAATNDESVLVGTGQGSPANNCKSVTKITAGNIKMQYHHDKGIACLAHNQGWIAVGDYTRSISILDYSTLLFLSAIELETPPQLILPGKENTFLVFSQDGTMYEVNPDNRWRSQAEETMNPIRRYSKLTHAEFPCETIVTVPIRTRALLYPGAFGKNIFFPIDETGCIFGLTRKNSMLVLTFRGKDIIICEKWQDNPEYRTQRLPGEPEIACMALGPDGKYYIGTEDGQVYRIEPFIQPQNNI